MIQLTRDEGIDSNPSWSPDGRTIAFRSNRSGNDDIWIMDTNGNSKKKLTRKNRNQTPAWSPDGQYIAFASGILDFFSSRFVDYEDRGMKIEEYQIRVVDANGQNEKIISVGEQDFSPNWSPDGQKIAFASWQNRGLPRIWIMDMDGQNRTRLTDHYGSEIAPSWSPDGRKIAYGSEYPPIDRFYNSELCVIDADGQNLVRLTIQEGQDEVPTWSPNGEMIAFVSTRGGSRDIWVMDVNGQNVRQLTTNDEDDDFPSWSPDGKKIAFKSDRSGNSDIWVMHLPNNLIAPSIEDEAPILVEEKLDKENIAVISLDAVGISETEATALTNRLRFELFRTRYFTVLERGEMYAILEEQDFQLTGCTTKDCLVEVGKLLNVRQIIAGSVSKVGNIYSVELRLIDVETSEILLATVEDIEDSIEELLTTGIKKIVLNLTTQIR